MSLIPAMFVPGAAFTGAVQGVLQEINVEEETIREIVAILDEYSEVLGSSLPGEIRQTVYGGSWRAESLGHHTRLAHDHVFHAMQSMMTTLSGAGDRVRAYHDDMVFTDQDRQDDLLRKRGRVDAADYTQPAGPVGPYGPRRPIQGPVLPTTTEA